MEYLLNIIKHMRSPLAFCASAKAVDTSWSAFKEKEDVPNSFYRIYAGGWERFSGIHNVFTPESIFDQSASQFLGNQRDEETIPSPAPRQIRVLGMMGLPNLKSAIFSYTENVEILLQEGKRVVPDVLNHDLNNLDEFLCSNHGFFRVGSATGEGFSCTVYRKSFDTGHRTTVPVYVIMGDLDITVDEFHALACDTDFRHQWDDQFHHVESSPIDSPQSLTRLLKWTSKWPWPMAAREYNYVLEPHVFDDGTRLVMAASVDSAKSAESRPISTAVPVKEYFGITAAKAIGDQKCRYCVFHFDDPRVGKMPKWIETYVANTLLPSFPKKLIEGAKKYPKERLVVFTSHYNS